MTATLLPDPAPRQRHYTIISVDDHLIEPADLFEGRMPAHLAGAAPRVVTLDNGRETWVYEDRFYPQVGLNAVVGRPKPEWNMEPARFDEMRRGCYDIEARVADMDLDGVYASLCFPSLIAGFAGTVFSASKDQELGLASLRAWNDWHIDEWAAPHPERVIPLQLTWLSDPEIAAADIRANAARGSRRSASPRTRSTCSCRRSTPTTGIRSCARARRPTPSCACTTGRRRGPRPAPPARRSRSTRASSR